MFKALMNGQQSMELNIQRLLDTSNDIYASLNKLRTYTEAGFDTMNSRFDRLESEFDGMEDRMDRFDDRMDGLDGRMENFENLLGGNAYQH